MKYKEYKEMLEYELFRSFKGRVSLLQRIRIKYFQPNTNCVYMARKMWYLHSKGKIGKARAKLLYLRIIRKYGCVIYPTAKIDKGFHITHPVGIVIGDCEAGEHFMVYQNCTVGTKRWKDKPPVIGDSVQLCSNSLIVGDIRICDHVTIGAQSLVLKDIDEPGVYAGNPLRKLK